MTSETYTLEVQKQNWSTLSKAKLDEIIESIEAAGIRYWNIFPSETTPEQKKTYEQLEADAQERLKSRIRKAQIHYENAKKKLWSEALQEKDRAWEDYKAERLSIVIPEDKKEDE